MWFNDASPSLGEVVTLAYMLESRDHTCWLSTKLKNNKTNLDAKINSTLIFTNMWYKLKTTPLLKPISFTGRAKVTVHWNLESSQQTFFHIRGPRC